MCHEIPGHGTAHRKPRFPLSIFRDDGFLAVDRMKTESLLSSIPAVAPLFALVALAGAAEPATDTAASPGGTHFIKTRVFTQEEDDQVLKAFEGLRVADVCDGMDAVGLQNIGLMDREIHPLWRDTEKFSHRFVGVAVTVRYVPTQQPPAGKRSIEDYDKWVGDWYKNKSPEPFQAMLRRGSALVIDDAPNADVGSIGSNNIMSWKLRGCTGVVTDATARDTDEIITEKVPLYLRKTGRGIRPGRNEVESVNRPVVVGGVLVMPGDIIIADGDGVLVVPRDHAPAVAAYARKILDGDKEGRRKLYEKLGLPTDPSVK
jgi:4-hydroxy-4-methyl-2-oxoglutarate aldolase